MASEKCVTQHRAYIYERGGVQRIAQIHNIEKVEYERTRDDFSTAEVWISGTSCNDQRELLSRIATKRHELVIFRGNQRVWEGPLWRIGDEGTRIKFAARDVLVYLFGTALSREWDNSYSGDGPTEVTSRFARIIEHELTTDREVYSTKGGTAVLPGWENIDPPANIIDHLTVHHFPNEARTSAKTLSTEMTVGDHLQGSSRTAGIDFTAVGRAIHIWDTSRNIGTIRTLTEADFFGRIIVTEYGADHTQAAFTAGTDGAYGEALNTDNLDFYGPWATVYTTYNEEGTAGPNQSELNSQAIRNSMGRSPVPYEVRIPDNSSIRLEDTLALSDLVPGVHVPLRATINARAYSQIQKIDHVKVVETADKEEVLLTLLPAARPDSDELDMTDGQDRVTANFPGGDFRLEVRGRRDGTTIQVTVSVRKLLQSATNAATNQDYEISINKMPGTTLTETGKWSYKYGYYNLKTVGTFSVEKASVGEHPFSVSVTMAGIGTATASGLVVIE